MPARNPMREVLRFSRMNDTGFKKEKKTIAEAIQKHIAELKETELREIAFQALLNDDDIRNEFADDDSELLAEEDRRERWKE